MKRIGKPWVIILAIVILVFSYLSFFGVYGTWGDEQKAYIRGAKDIRWGTDIQGGVSVTFGPQDIDASEEQMNTLKDILGTRLVNKNITDYEMYLDEDDDRVILSFPWKDGEVQDPQATINELSASTEVMFFDGAPMSVSTSVVNGETVYLDENKNPLVLSVKGEHVESAEVMVDTQTNEYCVQLNLTDEGGKLFKDATTRQLSKQISIWLNTNEGFVLLSAPVVNNIIYDSVAIISGNFTADSAATLANSINDGALPFKLAVIDYDIIDAALGKDSLTAMLIAGIIAFVLIALFMVIKYRLPGVVACFALLGQVACTLAIVSGFFPSVNSFTLTIPGIAGIILSVGMQVDANIITAERIKEELARGKSIDGALDSGTSESISAIVDGNITNMIVAIILMGVFGPTTTIWSKILTPFLFMFGPATTGTIYSFGCTMLAGAVLNIIFGLFVTKVMLKSASKFSIFRKKSLYGGVE